MELSRRQFVRTCSAVTLGFSGLHSLLDNTANAAPTAPDIVDGFGPIVRDPRGLLDLPNGFEYTVFSMARQIMNDGLRVPGHPDGMAAFPGPDGMTILVRNHEVETSWTGEGAFGRDNEDLDRIKRNKMYDYGYGKTPGLGGTTTILFDTRTQRKLDERLSLAGTVRNCAGGPTPWNSWVSCEETVDKKSAICEQDHGYNFEVPALYKGALVEPVPLTAMGRFNHEAVAVDPRSGIIYQTEDRDDGAIYRFIPNTPGQLQNGGILQALRARDSRSLDTRNWGIDATVHPGDSMQADWITLNDVEAPEDDLRYRAFERGGTRFARGEGMWAGNDAIYFACTSGGRNRCGQLWKYTPGSVEGTPDEAAEPGVLELFVEPNDSGLIDKADNLTVAPWGDIIVCEDGSGEQYLVGITPSGRIYKFGRNATGGSEFAGACFSPDGSTLFVNIQHMGLSLAVTGPWKVRTA